MACGGLVPFGLSVYHMLNIALDNNRLYFLRMLALFLVSHRKSSNIKTLIRIFEISSEFSNSVCRRDLCSLAFSYLWKLDH